MYSDENYDYIFGNKSKAGYIADLLKLDHYYKQYTDSFTKQRTYNKFEIPMIKNGKTFQIASFVFLCKLEYGIFSAKECIDSLEDIESLKILLRQTGSRDILINKNIREEQFYEIFDLISTEILGYCFENASGQMINEELIASDFLKLDNSYYRYIIPRLINRYERSKELKNLIADFCLQ